MKSLAILGRQPYLGLAELERTYGADAITPLIESNAALLDVAIEASEMARLGGTVKLAKVLTTLDTTDWRDIEKYLAKMIPEHLQYVPEGKLHLGLSVYGLNIKPDTINVTNLRLKKIIKAAGRSVRVIPNKEPALNSAQVIHNHLTRPNGWELLAVRSGRQTVLAQTIAEQDIEAYAARDQARPARDAFVGMLPPKLAQIMINLALPHNDHDIDTPHVLDPFCGTGVILQEAALLGYAVNGTDLSEKMVDYTRRNLKWLADKYDTSIDYTVELGDAMASTWSHPIDAVVCETYLGQPFSAPPSAEKLEQVRGNCDHIISEFLSNIGSQIEPGTSLCLAVPAWRDLRGNLTHLPLIEKLGQLGYKRIHLRHVKDDDIMYYRADQVVARELLLLEKK